ncbi:MAG: hypothetical protein RR037_06110 [Alistipes sp.]
MRCYAKIIYGVSALLTMVGCQELPAYFNDDTTLAKVGRQELYLDEVTHVAPEGLTGEDSVEFIQLYVDKWIKKQLKLQEAEALFSSAAEDIDAMVEEYRQSLLIRKLDQYYIDKQIDTVFTERDIQTYYNAHLAEFKLDRILVKGRVLRFNEGYRQANKLMALMRSNSPENHQDMADISTKNGFTLTEYTTAWTDFKTFLSNLPILGDHDYTPLLQSSNVQEMRDSHSHYYLQITAVRHVGDPQPLEMARVTIRRILFNQRQSEIIRAREEEMVAHAQEQHKIKRYSMNPIKTK